MFDALDGEVTNKGALEYKHKKGSLEGSCASATTTTTTTTTLCAGAGFSRTMGAVEDATGRNWPGGSVSFGDATCGGLLTRPTGNVSDLEGDTWAVTSLNGFSACTLDPQLPRCDSLPTIGSLLGNGRPFCPIETNVFGEPAVAGVVIDCN